MQDYGRCPLVCLLMSGWEDVVEVGDERTEQGSARGLCLSVGLAGEIEQSKKSQKTKIGWN